MGIVRFIATVLVLVAIVLPTAHYASPSGSDGHLVSVRHAPRTPSSSARITVVSGVNALPVLLLMPLASVSSSAAGVVVPPPLAAPFVPPRG